MDRLVVLDNDAYTSGLLVEELAQRGFGPIRAVSEALALPSILEEEKPEVFIFNYRADEPESLIACSTVRVMSPRCAIFALVSPGPASRAVRAWSAQTGCIDQVIEKPLSDDSFYLALRGLLEAQQASREVQARMERLSNLVPEAAMSAVEHAFSEEAELFEAAVLFTDVRGSSQLIRGLPPRDYFAQLNRLLTSQAALIRRREGSVIKFTGDGVMAVFRGMGRSYLCLRCALDLACAEEAGGLPFGVGAAEGLVLGGLIGDSRQAGHRRQYDVIGATVHLAARLCGMAAPGEVITTRVMNAIARLEEPASRAIGRVSVRGFDGDIDCVAFRISPSPIPEAPA